MPPKKNGESSHGSRLEGSGAKRKLQEARQSSQSRSQTPNQAGPSTFLSASHESQASKETGMEAISFTPMNAARGATDGSKRAQVKSISHNGASTDHGNDYDSPRDHGLLPLKNEPPKPTMVAETASRESLTLGIDSGATGSKIPRRKKSLKGLNEVEIKKENIGYSSAAPSKAATKQSTLEKHFRPKSQEPFRVDTAEHQPETAFKLKLKFKGQKSPLETQNITPAPTDPTLIAPTTTSSSSNSKSRSIGKGMNGAFKETLVLPTNPPSSDSIADIIPSPTIDIAEAQIIGDFASLNHRGRRTTRNAAPYYSGPPPTTTLSRSTTPVSVEVSPTRGKGGRKSINKVQANGGHDPSPELNGSGKGGNDRRPRGKGGKMLFNEAGEIVDVEPPKQQVAYYPRGPGSSEYGMMPLGVFPPKERIDEVFNKGLPKEPESRCGIDSGHSWTNFYGTVGNKDAGILKANQGRHKKALQKGRKLDANSDWIFADTEYPEYAITMEHDDAAPATTTPAAPRSRSSRTPKYYGYTSRSPSLPPDVSFSYFEDAVSPASDNIPETPREVLQMQIDDAPEVLEDTMHMDNPGEPIKRDLGKPSSKPSFLEIIRRAKAEAYRHENLEIAKFLEGIEAQGDTPATREILASLVQSDDQTRMSPATVPGTKRTHTQVEEDDRLSERDSFEFRRGSVKPFRPTIRGKRPDSHDNQVSEKFEKRRSDVRKKEAKLDQKYIPSTFTCFRNQADRKGKLLHRQNLQRNFDVDEKDWLDTFFKYKMGPISPEVYAEMLASREGNEAKEPPEGKRRRKTAAPKPAQIPIDADTSELGLASDPIEQTMDDEESPCTVCSGIGEPLVMCDGLNCNEEQHYGCAEPPLTPELVQSLPKWFCRKCTHSKQQNSRKGPEYRGIFGKLHDVIDKRNPRRFELPKKIREQFTGVETGETGNYEDTVDFYDLSRTKGKDWRAQDHFKILNELPLEERLKGADGELALCYACHRSRLRTDRGELLGCDYCSCYFHQDCLPIPTCSVPSIKVKGDKPNEKVLLQKWKCPLHAVAEPGMPRLPRRTDEGRDSHWPPKHRLLPPSAHPETPSKSNYQQIFRQGHRRRLPEDGFVLNLQPSVKRAREEKELSELVWTDAEIRTINSLRQLRENARPVDPLAAFLSRNLPDVENLVPGMNITGLEDDVGAQILIYKAIRDSLEKKLQEFGAAAL